jgi:hypothetical protein
VFALSILALFSGLGASSFRPVSATAVSGFNVVSAVWGNSATPVEAGPNMQNVPLVVTLQYYVAQYQYYAAQATAITISLPSGFTDASSGTSVTSAYISSELTAGAVIPVTFYINISSDVALGTYSFPMTIAWDSFETNAPYNQLVPLQQNSSVNVFLKGNVEFQFNSSGSALTPGVVNIVPITVSNTGSGEATDVILSVSTSSGALGQAGVSVLNSPPEIDEIKGNSSTTIYVNVFAPQSLASSSAALSLVGTYSNPYGTMQTISGSVGVYVASLSPAPLTVSLLSSYSLIPGSVNNATVSISNNGTQPLYHLQVSVTVPPSVSLLRQFPITLMNLNASSSTEISVPIFVSAMLSGSPITMPVSVTYNQGLGVTGSTVQNLGFYVPISILTSSPSIGLSGYTYNPPLIYPGTIVATLQVVIFNSGTTPASNLNVTLVPAKPVYPITNGSFTQTVGSLPVGQSYPFIFTLGILNSTIPANSTLGLSVRSSGTGPQEFTIPFVEQPKADFQVVSVSAPKVASGDGADQIIVTLRNVGDSAAQNTVFTMQPSYVFEPSTQGSFTTSVAAGGGTVSTGTTTNLTVVIQVNSNMKAGSYPLIFHATWMELGSTQPFSQDISLAIPVKLSVFQIIDGIIFTPLFIGIILVLIVALVALRTVRGRIRSRAIQART